MYRGVDEITVQRGPPEVETALLSALRINFRLCCRKSFNLSLYQLPNRRQGRGRGEGVYSWGIWGEVWGGRWHDLVSNSEVSLRTGLAPVSDRITRGRNAIFQITFPYTRPCYAKSSYRSVDPQTLHGNVMTTYQMDRPTPPR